MKKLFVFIFVALSLTACTVNRDARQTETNENKTVNSKEVTTGESHKGGEGIAAAINNEKKKTATDDSDSRERCLNIDAGDRTVLAKQTFPVDFEPFRDSCFVTTYNPEYDNPPLESEMAIYSGGREVFKFPNQFNGITFGCWVEAVAFQDLNSDNLTDIIVAGMCSAKSAPYSENMVYINTGKDFTTDEQANYKLQNFKRVKDIADYVKKNQNEFFRK